ncbi:hypothetical protein AADX89_11010 [Staphylococcus epidermidis]|nr:hypothetical protein [Staphylococcus epidermidis]MCO6206574.1 hypothetical protein [Staphylococcus epidermidis]MCO6209624.1 hypothetical protein [Staphylococcus epidermidis]MCO6213475.1 hypothetical protein [Staphylococcus epidermidis]MCO6224591.1 hypothetical protein [Staphylococcus epidermidis]MCO6235923.1 hypothetical protein [Staphylococcus epidermidis]
MTDYEMLMVVLTIISLRRIFLVLLQSSLLIC